MAAPAFTSPFVMQGARDAFAAGLAHVEEQVRSIEQAVVENPALAFDLARTLVVTVCRTILTERKVAYREDDILKPSPLVLREFGALVDPVDARIVSAAIESRTLAALRDALLPRLITGELRVENPETFDERVSS